MKRYVFESEDGKDYVLEANSEEEAWKKLNKDRLYDPDRIVLPPEFEDGGKFDVSAGMECEAKGGEWVDGFHTRHGWVRGYCRKKRNR